MDARGEKNGGGRIDREKKKKKKKGEKMDGSDYICSFEKM